ncbi:MAG: DUF2461 domain-containing protein [Candidatus Latescibacteria bacterium]|nr:DUF2461 domain-containing protein [Candidatus Latescibacterota bacterium]
MGSFTGFPQETPTYLRELGQNSNKTWFDDHRKEYECFYMEPAKAFVSAMGARLKRLAPETTAVPKVNKSIFRINNDTRFSKNKPPYKDHIDLWFYHGDDRKSGCSGFFFRLAPDEVCIGAGVHRFDNQDLGQFRTALVHDTTKPTIEQTVDGLVNLGFELGGEHYKRTPRGFEKWQENPLIRFNALNAFRMTDLPPSLHEASFVDWCEPYFEHLLPLHQWLLMHVRNT